MFLSFFLLVTNFFFFFFFTKFGKNFRTYWLNMWSSPWYALTKREVYWCVTGNQHSFLQVSSYSNWQKTITRGIIKEKLQGTPTQCAITWLTFRCYWQASFTSSVAEGWLMLMLMLNLTKLQHALSASIPNCVIYSKYTVWRYIFVICTNHIMYVLSLYFSFSFMNSLFHKIYRAGCKTSAIWACKHWIFLFLAVEMNLMVWK